MGRIVNLFEHENLQKILKNIQPDVTISTETVTDLFHRFKIGQVKFFYVVRVRGSMLLIVYTRSKATTFGSENNYPR